MNNQKIYGIFFPSGNNLPFRKTRWTVMVLLQELSMCKYKAILKYYLKKSYRRDIKVLMDILSRGKLKASKTVLILGDINFSHEINYPDWVEKLKKDLKEDPTNYKRIKVFLHNGKYLVVDGNHRLRALKDTLSLSSQVNVLLLEYV
jgi:hypothetical protein